MAVNRRDVLLAGLPLAAGAAVLAGPQQAEAKGASTATFDIAGFGLQPNGKGDQTQALQKVINQAARAGKRLLLPGGRFITGRLSLPSGLHMEGVRGATVLVFRGGDGFVSATGQQNITLKDLVFDGRSEAFMGQEIDGLLFFERVTGLTFEGCTIKDSLLNCLSLRECAGRVLNSTIEGAAMTGVYSLDAQGLEILHCLVRRCGNNGIQVWRSRKGYDGTLVANNRIEKIDTRAGGTGQNGNGVNVYRAGSVQVSNNVIEDCAFSAVRNNGGDNVQIVSNSCTRLGEVAIYSEFNFEGAVINNNLVDQAHVGISITNFNDGGRLATANGNLIRHIKKRQGIPGIGIAVEADTMVTGNVIEAVEGAGIGIGYGKYMRNVTANNNLVRDAEIGIGVSTHNEAGFALIATNMITGAKKGAVRAMDKDTPLGPDLSKSSAEAFRNLAVYGNVSL